MPTLAVGRLDSLIPGRERLVGPRLRARPMRRLPDDLRGAGRWYVGKWLLRTPPWWRWEVDMPTIAVGSLGAILALLVLVVCVVGLILVLGGVAFSVSPLVAIFLIGAVLAVARLT